jgi:hypothetical protein
MKKFVICFAFGLLLVSCAAEELIFTDKTFVKKSALAGKGNSTSVKVTVPIAGNMKIISDSINNKVFSVAKEIIYFGEKPYTSKDYDGLLSSFIGSYEQLFKEFPDYNIPWEASIDGKVIHQTDEILNIEIKHYSFTGGAHGYGGLRSILIDPNTGKYIPNAALFNDLKAFEKLAEEKFRIQFKIPTKDPINSTGMMFENEKFHLPNNIFYTEKGLLLYYNQYEIASYAEGPIELLFPYTEIENLLKLK